MHSILPLLFLLAQTLAPAPPTVQRVEVATGATARSVEPGGSTVLWIDVTPKPGIHVYAPDAKGFDPPKLIVSPHPGVAFGKPTFPVGQPTLTPGTTDRVPVYLRTFRVSQPVTVAGTMKPGGTLTLHGALNYQSCDDRLCYPTVSVPVSWTLALEQ
jgi:DsbC/DsbD-like thiol-disulfide interchange protein